MLLFKPNGRFRLPTLFKHILLACCCLAAFQPTMPVSSLNGVDFSAVLKQSHLLQTGDLLFRKGIGPGSRFVNMVDDNSEYSHVGIIMREENAVFVIHATPEAADGTGWVRKQLLSDFLSESTHIALYRVKPEFETLTETAVQNTIPWIDQIPFDQAFNLDTTDALYCTEFVWLAYKQAGLDLVDNQFDEIHLPLFKQSTFLLPSRLASSRVLDQIFIFPK